ncbi:hypothetical protein QE152_g33726 [Popillia japonica]|uniref:Uncharacterized protein n=1 Tax=Popillia japonica TaxID=7064 RepID=A0AAW1IW09_POPJA
MARIRYQTRDKVMGSKTEMSLEEAMKILNVSKLDKHQVEEQFKYLHEANEKSLGGSFYIQSKVVCAKERIDLEMSKTLSDDITSEESYDGDENYSKNLTLVPEEVTRRPSTIPVRLVVGYLTESYNYFHLYLQSLRLDKF